MKEYHFLVKCHVYSNLIVLLKFAYTTTSTSAAADRVFSVTKRSFDTEGVLECSVFLSASTQYNKVDKMLEVDKLYNSETLQNKKINHHVTV